MGVDVKGPDPFVDYIGTKLVRKAAHEAVVAQPDLDELGNHVGVRHASALYAGCYEAGRALVLAAVEDAADATVELVRGESVYTAVATGPLTFTAARSGDGWTALGSAPVEVGTHVTGRDEGGRTVVELQATWRVEPPA